MALLFFVVNWGWSAILTFVEKFPESETTAYQCVGKYFAMGNAIPNNIGRRYDILETIGNIIFLLSMTFVPTYIITCMGMFGVFIIIAPVVIWVVIWIVFDKLGRSYDSMPIYYMLFAFMILIAIVLATFRYMIV